ncbi:AMP-binding protein, partial [Azospirillum brasilense]|nr:AMP-binding protein [Azospirillum brasilense]
MARWSASSASFFGSRRSSGWVPFRDCWMRSRRTARPHGAAPPGLGAELPGQAALMAVNLYGPTENPGATLRAPVTAAERPVVGRPVGNVRVHVLDARLRPVPVGAVGELYIGGAGLA